MRFVSKNNLQYYQGVRPEFCYCDYLAQAGDMYLQGMWNPSKPNYTASVEVWSVDGNTALEVVPSNYYYIYFARHPFTGQHYFTFRLKSFTDVMCANKCFLMRIGISNADGDLVFASFTERYCIPTCCAYAKGITAVDETGTPQEVYPDAFYDVPPVSDCGKPLIKIITSSSCWNRFSTEYFGQPNVIFSGSYFPYYVITTIKAQFGQRPSEIVREYSYNCKLQMVERAKQYQLTAIETFPQWKMDEIEGQFASSNIVINDFRNGERAFEFNGGAIMERVPAVCPDAFTMNATINECLQRQIFGCTPSCVEEENIAYFVIPVGYQGGYFYDNNGLIIANDVDSLLVWFNSQGLSSSFYALSPPLCDYTAIVGVTGNIIPSSIYYDSPTPDNQIGALYVALEDICDYIPKVCYPVIVNSISYEDMPCDQVTVNGITYEDITGTALTLYDVSPWSLSADTLETNATLFGNTVTMDIKGSRMVVGTPTEDYYVYAEEVAYISALGVPQTIRILDENNSTMPAGSSIMIDELGRIYLSGTFEIQGDNTIFFDFDNLVYNIT